MQGCTGDYPFRFCLIYQYPSSIEARSLESHQCRVVRLSKARILLMYANCIARMAEIAVYLNESRSALRGLLNKWFKRELKQNVSSVSSGRQYSAAGTNRVDGARAKQFGRRYCATHSHNHSGLRPSATVHQTEARPPFVSPKYLIKSPATLANSFDWEKLPDEQRAREHSVYQCSRA